ncbi:hypothetical protein LguiA_002352 [Lonicera macranthoides]
MDVAIEKSQSTTKRLRAPIRPSESAELKKDEGGGSDGGGGDRIKKVGGEGGGYREEIIACLYFEFVLLKNDKSQ